MKKLYSFILTAVCATSLWGQSVETSGFEPATIRPDDAATYTVILKDISGNIDSRSIPMPDGLQIVGQSRSQSFSMGTGGTSSSTKIAYTVRALKEGSFTVPEWTVEYKGNTYKISAATLKVDASAPAQAQQQQQMSDPFGMGGITSIFGNARGTSAQSRAATQHQNKAYEDSLRNNAKLEIKLPREKIYVGESVPCELVFSFDKTLLRNGFNLAQLMPEIKKADAFDCPAFTSDPTIDKTSSPDKVFINYHTVITPLKVGTYDLDFSARGIFNREMSVDDLMGMSLMDRMMSMNGARQLPFEIQMPAKKIEVLDLPAEGKPANFTGAIGKFSLDDVTIDPDALSVGEPAVIFAKVVGMGNFGRISAPELSTDGNWKTYKPKTSFSDESNGDGYIGIKTFEFTVVPTKPDLKSAPTVMFNYFDPNTQKYVEIASKDLPISVAPTGRSKRAQEQMESENSKSAEPAFAQILDKSQHTQEYRLLTSPLFWALQLTILALVILFILHRRRTLKLENNPAFAKRVNYKKSSSKFLKKAHDDAQRNDAKSFFADARAALQHALAAGTDKEGSALILREAQDIMNELELEQAHIDAVGVYFEGADAITFGGLDISKINLNELDKKLEKICRAIEK